MADLVDLTELELVRRYSLALRVGEADRDEVAALLEADLAWLRHPRQPGHGGGGQADGAPRPIRISPARRRRV